MNSRICLIILVALLNSSSEGYTEVPLFLTSDDFLMEKVSNKEGAPISYWDSAEQLIPSFSKWRCFPTFSSTVTCTIHEMDGLIRTPMVAVYSGDETLEIETSTADNIDCESTTMQWSHLLEGEEIVCTLASFLQDLPHENYGGTHRRTLWIIQALKTSKGYWITPRLHEKLN